MSVLADLVLVTHALFVGFGESSLNFTLLAWVPTIDVGLQAQNALRVAILRKLETAGIAIPFPQRDLHVYHRDADGRPLSELLLRGVADDGDHRPRPPRG